MGETVDTSAEAPFVIELGHGMWDCSSVALEGRHGIAFHRRLHHAPVGQITAPTGSPLAMDRSTCIIWFDGAELGATVRAIVADAERMAIAAGASVPEEVDMLAAERAARQRAEAELDVVHARCAACALFTGTPGAMTVNCVRGTVRCTERERIEAERDRNLEALAELAQRYAREGLAERARAERAEAGAARLRSALIAARGFIRNGVELGFIRMPDAETPDPAHDTLPIIEAALAANNPDHENTPETEVGRR